MKVLFFAQFRERLGVDQLIIEQPGIDSVEMLVDHFAKQEGHWQDVFGSDQMLVAVNQQIVDRSTRLKPDDEVAFFPPVTGG